MIRIIELVVQWIVPVPKPLSLDAYGKENEYLLIHQFRQRVKGLHGVHSWFHGG